MLENTTITFGCDPELFLQDQSGKVISSIGLVGGSKENPKPIGNGCFIQEDNVAVEFNIPPVEVNDIDIAFKQIKQYFNYVFNWIEKEICEPNNLVISTIASATFTSDQLDNEAAQTFGCDPDYNAYTKQENPKPIGPEGLRTCGGHVHIGLYEPDSWNKEHVIILCDAFLGLNSILKDTDTTRRELYGKAGCFRNKSYGVEYRTLSNYWLFDDEELKRILKFLNFLSRLGDYGISWHKMSIQWSEAIQQAIDTQDKELAKYILDVLKPEAQKCGLE